MRSGRGRCAQRQSLDPELQRLGEAGTAPVGAHGPAQASQSAVLVTGQPPLQRPVRDPGLGGHADQRNAVLEVRPQGQPAAMRFRAAILAERDQRRLTGGARHLIQVPYRAGSTAAGARSLSGGCSARYSVERPILRCRAMAATDSPRARRAWATVSTSSSTAAGRPPRRP